MAFEGVDTITLLAAGMKTAQRNQRLIAQNIANIDTPHYSPVHMDFQATLRATLEGRDRFSLRKTLPRHLDAVREVLAYEKRARFSKNDQNKVDLEDEMARLNRNTERYTTYSALLQKKFREIKDMLTNIQ